MISAENIIAQLQVLPRIDNAFEVQRRLQFMQNKLQATGCTSLVLGISGGVDSTLCGKLAQMAVSQLREATAKPYQFIAVRLPYAQQKDEADAQAALDFIQPDVRLCINIAHASDAIHQAVSTALSEQQLLPNHANTIDFVKGNVKARQRMIAQYEIAGLANGLVLGSDHAAENLTGFYTKWGDGACDLAPLYGLNKRQIRQLTHYLGASESLVNKIPTADLLGESPLEADEHALGVSYDDIDDFLEGKKLSTAIEQRLIQFYLRSQHKRQPIPTLYNQHNHYDTYSK